MTAPLWLKEPGVQHLLHVLVDKLDAAEAQGKPLARPIRLDGKSFPALYRALFEDVRERQWSHLKQLESWGWLTVHTDRPKDMEPPYECNARLSIQDEAAIRQATGRLARVRSANEYWRDAVYRQHRFADSVKEAVARMRLEVPGRTADEVVEQLSELPQIAEEPLLLREASARLFWGLSKVLDGRQQLVATVLQAEECPFPEMPIQLQVYLPPTGFTGVLFIENLATFEQASRSGAMRYSSLALVYAAGFKGGARRLRSATGASVYFAAHGAMDERLTGKLLSWLRAGTKLPCWFWGDLDHAGMRILAALRKVFDGISAWEPGYSPMVERLLEGHGHAPEAGLKSGQLELASTGCSYADQTLIPALAQIGKFVDQEVV